MVPIEIDDPGDPRIAAYRNIRERDLVGREGRFIAEGRVVLKVLLESRFAAESILVLRRRLPGLAGLIAQRPDVPVYVVDDDIMQRIAGFAVHRGILAVGRRNPQAATLDPLLADAPENAVIVVCLGISNHDNIGSIFRNAAAFGVHAVLLDKTSCDPLYRKAVRVSVGGVLKTPFGTFNDALALAELLDRAGFRQFALSPQGAIDVGSIEVGGQIAIYLGSEGEGLPADLMQRIATVRIPIVSDFDSLNVAATSAIALHRLTTAKAGVS